MTSNEILKADVLDIVFDNRNKNYGAYVLRRNYNNRLAIALGVMLGSVLITAMLLGSSSGGNSLLNPDNDPVVELTQVNLEPPVKPKDPEPPQRTQPQDVKQAKLVNGVQIVDDNIQTDVATQEDLLGAIVSTQNVEGVPSTDPHQGPMSANNNGGAGGTAEAAVTETEQPLGETKAPEFPGGQQAWMNFLRKHLVTPAVIEAGEKRTVMVRFTVGTDGSISSFEVLRSAGEECDHEVIRVLKKMPKWKPAVQNGQKVSVAFTQPVTFMAFEE